MEIFVKSLLSTTFYVILMFVLVGTVTVPLAFSWFLGSFVAFAITKYFLD